MPNLCPRVLNQKRDPVDARDRLKARRVLRLDQYPPSGFVTKLGPVMDQGQTGSCAGHTIALMWRQVLGSRGMGADFNFSPWYSYYYARLLDGDVSVDEGVTSRSAIKSLQRYGCAPADMWTSHKPLNLEPDEIVTTFGKALTIPAYARCETLQDIKHSISVENQSVFFGFPVFENWNESLVNNQGLLQYPTGPKQPIGGHAITLIGYDDNFPMPGHSNGALKARNSYGPNWGISGDFWITYDYLQEWWDAWTCDFEAIPDSVPDNGGAD